MSDADVVRVLKREIKAAKSLRAWATAHKFSPTFISQVLAGKSKVSERLAESLGFSAVPSDEKWRINGSH